MFNAYFGKFVMKFIDIGVIGLISVPKYYRVVIVVNLVKQTWVFFMMLPVGVVVCMLGQYRDCVCWNQLNYWLYAISPTLTFKGIVSVEFS